MARLTLRLPIANEYGSEPAKLIDLARRAEQAGFGAVSISDHVVMGPHAERYPWGDFPFAPDAPWYEPMSVLTAIAASTETIGLTTGILIVPLRPAALLAKWAATVDVISGGRLELGVGTGWQKEEFDALGLDHRSRGCLLTDYIGACRALWSGGSAAFESPSVTFSETWCDPKPAQRGGIPVLFSGTLTSRNLDRIVRLGDGWIPIMGERRAGIASGVQLLRERLEAAGRDPEVLRVRSAARVVAGDVAGSIERSADLIEAGVTDVDLPFSFFVTEDAGVEPFFGAAAAGIGRAGWLGAGRA